VLGSPDGEEEIESLEDLKALRVAIAEEGDTAAVSRDGARKELGL
jgi:hypothetical protein